MTRILPIPFLRSSLGCAFAFWFTLSCDGTQLDAPSSTLPPTCPSTEDVLGNAKGALEAGRLAAFTDASRTILFDDGGARVLLPALLSVSQDISVDSAFTLTEGANEGRGVSRLTPHLIAILGYFDGQAPYSQGDANYAPLDAVHQIVTQCDTAETLVAIGRLNSLEVTVNGQTKSWIDGMFELMGELAEDPVVSELLSTLEVEENEGVPSEEGRASFQVLTRLVLADASSPNFELDTIRTLFDDFVLSRIPPEATATRARVEALFEVLEQALDPDAEIAEPISALVRCINDTDEESEFAGMVYDYLQIDELRFADLVRDLNTFGEEEAGIALARLLRESLASLEQTPRLVRDSANVLARFISPEYSRQTVPALIALEGEGVMGDLLRFVNALFYGCGETEEE